MAKLLTCSVLSIRVSSISPDVLFGSDYSIEESWTISQIPDTTSIQVGIRFSIRWRDLPWPASSSVRGENYTNYLLTLQQSLLQRNPNKTPYTL